MEFEKKQRNYDNLILCIGILISAALVIYLFFMMDKAVIKEYISEMLFLFDYAVDLFLQSLK